MAVGKKFSIRGSETKRGQLEVRGHIYTPGCMTTCGGVGGGEVREECTLFIQYHGH